MLLNLRQIYPALRETLHKEVYFGAMGKHDEGCALNQVLDAFGEEKCEFIPTLADKLGWPHNVAAIFIALYDARARDIADAFDIPYSTCEGGRLPKEDALKAVDWAVNVMVGSCNADHFASESLESAISGKVECVKPD